jgi:hypothetical protein
VVAVSLLKLVYMIIGVLHWIALLRFPAQGDADRCHQDVVLLAKAVERR